MSVPVVFFNHQAEPWRFSERWPTPTWVVRLGARLFVRHSLLDGWVVYEEVCG